MVYLDALTPWMQHGQTEKKWTGRQKQYRYSRLFQKSSLLSNMAYTMAIVCDDIHRV